MSQSFRDNATVGLNICPDWRQGTGFVIAKVCPHAALMHTAYEFMLGNSGHTSEVLAAGPPTCSSDVHTAYEFMLGASGHTSEILAVAACTRTSACVPAQVPGKPGWSAPLIFRVTSGGLGVSLGYAEVPGRKRKTTHSLHQLPVINMTRSDEEAIAMYKHLMR